MSFDSPAENIAYPTIDYVFVFLARIILLWADPQNDFIINLVFD